MIPVDGDIIRGAKLFSKECGSCHNLENAQNDRPYNFGNLYGRLITN